MIAGTTSSWGIRRPVYPYRGKSSLDGHRTERGSPAGDWWPASVAGQGGAGADLLDPVFPFRLLRADAWSAHGDHLVVVPQRNGGHVLITLAAPRPEHGVEFFRRDTFLHGQKPIHDILLSDRCISTAPFMLA